MKGAIRLAVIVAGVGVFAALSWAAMDTMIHATGDDEFCSGCHSHLPISTSYREDLHGGNNPSGWRATCSDCHIPSDNALHYLWVKGRHGVVDPAMELLKDPLDIDWHGHRELRERFVYDSGCLKCHKYLDTATLPNARAFRPHRDYFRDPEQLKCVSCHQHVGHSRLGIHLEQHGWHNARGDDE